MMCINQKETTSYHVYDLMTAVAGVKLTQLFKTFAVTFGFYI